MACVLVAARFARNIFPRMFLKPVLVCVGTQVGVRARVENVLGAVDRWRPPEPLLVKLLRDRAMVSFFVFL